MDDRLVLIPPDDHSPEAEQLREHIERALAQHEEIMSTAPQRDLDVSIRGLYPDRLVHLTRLTIIHAYDVVRIAYEIVPLSEPPSTESAAASRALGPWGWMVGGRDDQGTIYDDHGGTFGVPLNGLLADGDRDLAPAPPREATWLEVTIHHGDPLSTAPVYALRIELPLRPVVA